MTKNPSKIFFIIIFSFILLWGTANLTGYFLINEFVKTDYFRDLIIKKLQLRSDISYKLKLNARIHWNPFAFGLVINDLSLKDDEKKSFDFVNCKIERSDIKFSIIQLVLGNSKPQEIFIKNSHCFLNSDAFLKNQIDNSKKKIDEIFGGIKTLEIKNSVIEFNKKKYFFDYGVIKKKKRKLKINIMTHDEYIKELKFNGEGLIYYDEWNRIDIDCENLNLNLTPKSLKFFPKIDDISLKSSGKIQILFDDFLKFQKINFNFYDLDGDLWMKNEEEKQKIVSGEIVGNYIESLKFEKIKFNFNNSEILGNGEFILSKKLLKGVFDFKDFLVKKISYFWPSNIAPNTKKFYEDAIKDGAGNGKIDLFFNFSNEWKFLEEKSRINLKSEIRNGSIKCCGDKFPEIRDINGKINLTLDDLNGEIKKARIDKSIDLKDVKLSLNFYEQKLFLDGKANSELRNFIDLYEKDYKIQILEDDILKNIKGEGVAEISMDVDLKNENKINTNIEIYSKNISNLLEKNELKIDQGEIFMKIKNNEMKFDFHSNSNNRNITLIGDVNSKKGIYKMRFDEDYDSIRKIFDPMIGDLIKINKRLSGDMNVENIDDKLEMKFDINLDNSELKAQYLKLDKKVGEKAKVIFNLDKKDNNLFLDNLSFFSEDEKKKMHKVQIENLKYLKDIISIKNLIINERNIIKKIEIRETKNERNVEIDGKNIFYNDFDWFGFTSEDQSDVGKKISVIGKSDKLSFSNKSFFSNINFDLFCEKNECKKIILNNCNSLEKSKINAAIINDRILIGTNNAGKLLKGINITKYIDGGTLRLEGYLDKYNNKTFTMQNSLSIKGFRIKNAPIVARILNLASLNGLLSIFTGKGVFFNLFDANFVFTGNKAIFAKSIVEGQAMAIEFEGEINLNNDKMDLIGSLMPFNFINMILRMIPGVGPIFVGNRGEGLLMVDFRMKGDLQNPTISVNPMSFFTPYTLKKIFKKQKK
jgi:hypothetical protein